MLYIIISVSCKAIVLHESTRSCNSCDHKLGPLNEFVTYIIKCNELNLAAAAMLV